MPQDKFGKMEADLKREAAKKGLTGARAEAYVYGSLRKAGWTPTPSQNT